MVNLMLAYIFKYLFMDFLKVCICISTGSVSLSLVYGQILIIFDKVMALVNFQLFSGRASHCPA